MKLLTSKYSEMNITKKIPRAILFFLIIATIPALTYSQFKNSVTDKEGTIQGLVNDKDFVFVAQTALPLRGPMRQLTSAYDVLVSKDTIVSNLPYFGRAFAAPIDPSAGGINFTSTKFEYTAQERRKGWTIGIKPADVRDVQQLTLDVSKNGSASLKVVSLNRQAISFNGFIRERKSQ